MNNPTPAVPATAINGPLEPKGESSILQATSGVQHYSEPQLTQISRLAPIKYCTLPEYYLQDAINEYFPQSPSESKEAYKDRCSRAPSAFEPFYPYLRDLIVGTALRKGVKYESGTSWDDFFKNVDLEGTSVNSFAKKGFTAALDGGVAGLWVDYPVVRGQLTAAEERRQGYRPWWMLIKCEDILEIRHAIRTIDINGTPTMGRFPIYVRLRATYEPGPTENKFYSPTFPAAREYYIEDVIKEDGTTETVVRWVLYALLNDSDGSAKDSYEEVDNGTINKSFIPFVPLYGGSVESYTQARPQLLDIARLNLHHWIICADLANNIHNSSFELIYGTGVRADEKIDLESDKIMTAESPDARFGVLSAEMRGADAALSNLARIEKSMDSLAAVAVTTAKPQAESGFSKLLDRAQSDSQLAVLVQSLEDSLNLLINFTSSFMDGVEPIEITISKDFIPIKLHSQQLMAMMTLWERSPLPVELLYKVLEVGMVFEGIPDFDVKKVLERLELDGSETSIELGYGKDGNQKPESAPGDTHEPAEASVENPEALAATPAAA